MRIKWRGLELPSRVVRDESVSTKFYGRFIVEPFEQGFGTTIGNSLRRVLLSSLEGAAVTSVKIEGVSHEFTTIDGVMEDVTDIILNIKGVLLSVLGDEPRTMTVSADKAGEVRAGDIEADPSVTIENPEHKIATLTTDVPFRVEMTVGKGRGFVPSAENRTPDAELGILPVDSIFSPVLRVRYRTEDMRVGQRTNYDRLIIEVWTNGTVSPEDALVEAGLILRKHLNPFVMYDELGDRMAMPSQAPLEQVAPVRTAAEELLDKPISVLNLSVRANNCLEAAKISTLRELTALTDADLLRFRSFGKTSLHEVHRKLADLGLSIGMGAGLGDGVELGEGALPASLEGDAEVDTTPGASLSADTGQMEAFTMGE